MMIRGLTLALAGTLFGTLAVVWWAGQGVEETVHGMSDVPCGADGLPVSGKISDDWAQLCRFHIENGRLRKSGSSPKVVMIGDSITANWPTQNSGFANRGIAGQISGQVLLRFQQDALALQPRVIHILVGINDVTGKYGPESPDHFKNNVRAMVALAKVKAIPVVIGTIGPAQDVAWRPQVDRRRWVPIINAWLKRFARDEGIVLADYHAVLSAKNGSMRREFFADTVHPSAKGYAAMEPVLRDALDRACPLACADP